MLQPLRFKAASLISIHYYYILLARNSSGTVYAKQYERLISQNDNLKPENPVYARKSDFFTHCISKRPVNCRIIHGLHRLLGIRLKRLEVVSKPHLPAL
jgi:hypothetical protein